MLLRNVGMWVNAKSVRTLVFHTTYGSDFSPSTAIDRKVGRFTQNSRPCRKSRASRLKPSGPSMTGSDMHQRVKLQWKRYGGLSESWNGQASRCHSNTWSGAARSYVPWKRQVWGLGRMAQYE